MESSHLGHGGVQHVEYALSLGLVVSKILCMGVYGKHRSDSKNHLSLTLGMVVFNMLSMVVIVRTEVTPRVTRAAVDSEGIQKDIHDNMTIREQGA